MRYPFHRMLSSNRGDGFTLLEVINALMIASIGMAGSFSLSLYLLRSAQWADNLQEATLAGKALLESLQAVEYEDLADGQDVYYGLVRRWTVTSNDHYQVVEVLVEWEAISGGTRQLPMQTLFNDPDHPGVTINP